MMHMPLADGTKKTLTKLSQTLSHIIDKKRSRWVYHPERLSPHSIPLVALLLLQCKCVSPIFHSQDIEVLMFALGRTDKPTTATGGG
jgi:hypothetical protein